VGIWYHTPSFTFFLHLHSFITHHTLLFADVVSQRVHTLGLVINYNGTGYNTRLSFGSLAGYGLVYSVAMRFYSNHMPLIRLWDAIGLRNSVVMTAAGNLEN